MTALQITKLLVCSIVVADKIEKVDKPEPSYYQARIFDTFKSSPTIGMIRQAMSDIEGDQLERELMFENKSFN